MDDRSTEILELLASNCRLTADQIAGMLDMDAEEVRRTIAALEAKKIILGYRAMVNWERAGKERVLAFIEIKVQPQRDVGFQAVAERIYRYPEVKTLYLMSGAFDLAALVEGRTMQDVANFVATKLAPIEGVMSTTTHFVMQTYKEEGVVLDEYQKDRRLVVSP
ncbi:MAG: Putative transcriptional regulator, AsnC family [Clostridia bacterium 62_21]|nr:MAG: Putative transcriptional regulator, AsnC family [Clostridia bacterium 62_21]